jgi:hypothetical protein
MLLSFLLFPNILIISQHLTYLRDVSKDVGVKCKIVFRDVEVALEQDITDQRAGVSCREKQ